MLNAVYDTKDIADAIGRSRGTVYIVLNNPTKLSSPPRSKRFLAVSNFSLCCMMHKARTGLASAQMVRSALNSFHFVRKFRHYMSRNKNLVYRRMRWAFVVTQIHRDRRVQWATAKVSSDLDYLAKAIRSDEKKFTVSGPDGMAYYWCCKRCQEKMFQR